MALVKSGFLHNEKKRSDEVSKKKPRLPLGPKKDLICERTQQEGNRKELVHTSSNLPSIEEAISLTDADGHGNFRDHCAYYAENCRRVFLEEIERFIRTAKDSKELDAICKVAEKQKNQLRKRGKTFEPGSQFDAEWLAEFKAWGGSVPRGPTSSKKGRPRAYSHWTDWDWIKNARRVAWERHVLGWSWLKIADHAGLSTSATSRKTTEQMLRRLRNQYAALIWNSIPVDARGPSDLRKGALDNQTVRYCLKDKAGLPFDSDPEQSKRLVLELAPIGQKEHAYTLVGGKWVVFTDQ